MNIDISTTSNVKEAIELYAIATHKAMADVLNRTVAQVGWHANFLTRHRQDIWPIRKVDEPILQTIRGKTKKSQRNKEAVARLKGYHGRLQQRGATGKGMKTKNGVDMTPESAHRLFYALAKKANPGAKHNALTSAAHRVWSKRRHGKGYTANSWSKAVEEAYPSVARRLEQARRGTKWNKGSKGVAKQFPAGAVLATQYVQQSKGTATAPAIEIYGVGPVQTGAALAAADMQKYAVKLISELGDKALRNRITMRKI